MRLCAQNYVAMDAKDLKAESAFNDHNTDGRTKYAQGIDTHQYDKNKHYQEIGSHLLGKVDVQTTRPCAVIGPDRVVPQPESNAYLKKDKTESWPVSTSSTYSCLPEYPHKLTEYQNHAPNISPRLTFQENMPRIMVSPRYNPAKLHENTNFHMDRNVQLKNVKLNVAHEAKYSEVPYTNNINNDQKNRRSSELCVSDVNPGTLQNGVWPVSNINIHSRGPYNSSELYPYPDYSPCTGSKPVHITRPVRLNEEHYPYSDLHYHPGNIRYRPYPTVKERYPPPRYDYNNSSRFPTTYHPTPFPSHNKIDVQKQMGHSYPGYSQVHPRYRETRLPDTVIDGYQRPIPQQVSYNTHYRNQMVHNSYPLANCIQSKLTPYNSDSSRTIPTNKLPLDPNKVYIEYDAGQVKNYPTSENCYPNDVSLQIPAKNQVLPSYPQVNVHPMHSYPYHKKNGKSYEQPYQQFRNVDLPLNVNQFPRSHFSPKTIAISPSEAVTNHDTSQIHGYIPEDCGYVSQSSSTSVKSIDSMIRLQSECRRYDYRYSSIVKNSPTISKTELNSNRNQESKCKKDINVRQFFQMWNEGDEENSDNNKEVSTSTMEYAKQFENANKQQQQEQLYVLDSVNVPSEDLSKYEHIQKVSKLPENIKGFNNIELLTQFEEAIESSNINNCSIPKAKHEVQNLLRLNAKQRIESLSRPVSPFDVEAKISQSVIHKEVGCNFEIKPCSPQMLNADIAAPIHILSGERLIKKFSNPLINSPKMLNHSNEENIKSNNIIKISDDVKIPSCKMAHPQHSKHNQLSSIKSNYTIQDLESNSGVCLSSLPRLDNDIELSFPEVNQQFIDANKINTVPSLPSDSGTVLDPVINKEIKTTEVTNSYLPSVSETVFTKLSKFRKPKNNADHRENDADRNIRKDSVIIKNPDNKHFEHKQVISTLDFEENQQNPINLSTQFQDPSSDILKEKKPNLLPNMVSSNNFSNKEIKPFDTGLVLNNNEIIDIGHPPNSLKSNSPISNPVLTNATSFVNIIQDEISDSTVVRETSIDEPNLDISTNNNKSQSLNDFQLGVKTIDNFEKTENSCGTNVSNNQTRIFDEENILDQSIKYVDDYEKTMIKSIHNADGPKDSEDSIKIMKTCAVIKNEPCCEDRVDLTSKLSFPDHYKIHSPDIKSCIRLVSDSTTHNEDNKLLPDVCQSDIYNFNSNIDDIPTKILHNNVKKITTSHAKSILLNLNYRNIFEFRKKMFCPWVQKLFTYEEGFCNAEYKQKTNQISTHINENTYSFTTKTEKIKENEDPETNIEKPTFHSSFELIRTEGKLDNFNQTNNHSTVIYATDLIDEINKESVMNIKKPPLHCSIKNIIEPEDHIVSIELIDNKDKPENIKQNNNLPVIYSNNDDSEISIEKRTNHSQLKKLIGPNNSPDAINYSNNTSTFKNATVNKDEVDKKSEVSLEKPTLHCSLKKEYKTEPENINQTNNSSTIIYAPDVNDEINEEYEISFEKPLHSGLEKNIEFENQPDNINHTNPLSTVIYSAVNDKITNESEKSVETCDFYSNFNEAIETEGEPDNANYTNNSSTVNYGADKDESETSTFIKTITIDVKKINETQDVTGYANTHNSNTINYATVDAETEISIDLTNSQNSSKNLYESDYINHTHNLSTVNCATVNEKVSELSQNNATKINETKNVSDKNSDNPITVGDATIVNDDNCKSPSKHLKLNTPSSNTNLTLTDKAFLQINIVSNISRMETEYPVICKDTNFDLKVNTEEFSLRNCVTSDSNFKNESTKHAQNTTTYEQIFNDSKSNIEVEDNFSIKNGTTLNDGLTGSNDCIEIAKDKIISDISEVKTEDHQKNIHKNNEQIYPQYKKELNSKNCEPPNNNHMRENYTIDNIIQSQIIKDDDNNKDIISSVLNYNELCNVNLTKPSNANVVVTSNHNLNQASVLPISREENDLGCKINPCKILVPNNKYNDDETVLNKIDNLLVCNKTIDNNSKPVICRVPDCDNEAFDLNKDSVSTVNTNVIIAEKNKIDSETFNIDKGRISLINSGYNIDDKNNVKDRSEIKSTSDINYKQTTNKSDKYLDDNTKYIQEKNKIISSTNDVPHINTSNKNFQKNKTFLQNQDSQDSTLDNSINLCNNSDKVTSDTNQDQITTDIRKFQSITEGDSKYTASLIQNIISLDDCSKTMFLDCSMPNNNSSNIVPENKVKRLKEIAAGVASLYYPNEVNTFHNKGSCGMTEGLWEKLNPTTKSYDNNFKQNHKTKRPVAKQRSSLKRSLSESAINSFESDLHNSSNEDLFHVWSNKRKKNNLPEESIATQLISDNLCNIIQNARRNSIATIYNEDVSFCILIDNDCIITEDCEESDLCLSNNYEIAQNYIANNSINCENSETCLDTTSADPCVLECDDEKSVSESWVEDIACVETVVTDDVAEDIIISTTTSPKLDFPGHEIDVDNLKFQYFNSNVNEHTDKVKLIYGENMCNNDAQLVEKLFRTPQMDVNKTLVDKESQDTEEVRFYDEDSLVKVLSEPNHDEMAFNYNATHEIVLHNDLITSNNSEMNIFKSNVTVKENPQCLKNELINDQPNICEGIQQRNPPNEIGLPMIISYNQSDNVSPSLVSSSSPEVSSTTSEDKNSSILLKITSYKGSRISHLSESSASTGNKIRCKLTEEKDYLYYNQNTSHRLLTKAAKKYIPPLKEIIPDLKIKLPLPHDSLLKLKQLKIRKAEVKSELKLKNDCLKDSRKDINKKIKPKFEDVLKSIDEIQIKMHKEKTKKPKKDIPKVVIKKRENGSHYASTSNSTYNPDLTGRKWQPWVFLEKNTFIDKMANKKRIKAVYSHRKKTYVLAENFKKYKSMSSTKFIITHPKIDEASKGHLKCTIKLKHSY